MNNNEARQYFKDKGLDYSKIEPIDLRRLSNILETELINYLENGGLHAQQMDMVVSVPLKRDSCFLTTKLKYAFIKIDGSYFSKREGISFNQDGWIGFGGEFSTVNTEPILKAFCKWCDILAEKL